jgi:ABC-type Mn2+/Zn2+ transport system permease subunit
MITQIIMSLLSGVLISATAAYLGTLMLSKRMSVVAGPLAHLAFPGVALAIMYDFSFALGVFPFVLAGALFIWYFEQKTKLPMENLSAVIFAIGVGTSLLFLPIGEAQAALVGSIMQIKIWEVWMVVIFTTLVFYCVTRIYKTMMIINIYEDIARANKVNISVFNLIYVLSIAIIVALGVYLVGGLITAALIAIPAGAARNISRSLKSYKFWAIFFGVTGTVTGIIMSLIFTLPAGPLIVVTEAIIFICTLVYKLIKSKQ